MRRWDSAVPCACRQAFDQAGLADLASVTAAAGAAFRGDGSRGRGRSSSHEARQGDHLGLQRRQSDHRAQSHHAPLDCQGANGRRLRAVLIGPGSRRNDMSPVRAVSGCLAEVRVPPRASAHRLLRPARRRRFTGIALAAPSPTVRTAITRNPAPASRPEGAPTVPSLRASTATRHGASPSSMTGGHSHRSVADCLNSASAWPGRGRAPQATSPAFRR
jgi:hypothetical protein